MEHKCITYADQLLEAKSKIRDLTDQLAQKTSEFEQLTESHDALQNEHKNTCDELLSKARLAQTLQLDHDNILFKLNEQAVHIQGEECGG